MGQAHSHLRGLVWNVNQSVRLDHGREGKAYPYYKMSSRIPGILDLLKSRLVTKFAHIILLCEVGGSLVDFKKFADENDYGFESVPYNASSNSLHYVIIYLPEVNICCNVLSLTSDGNPVPRDELPKEKTKPTREQRMRALGDEFPRSVLGIRLTFEETYECMIYFVHLGHSNIVRLEQTKKLMEHMANAPPIDKVILGDFNCIDTDQKFYHKRPVSNPFERQLSWIMQTNHRQPVPRIFEPQLDLLRQAGWTQQSHYACTFRAYPFDIVRKLDDADKESFTFLLKSSTFNPRMFRTTCDKFAEKYGVEGPALDQVFTQCLEPCEIKAEVEHFDLLSDHGLVSVDGSKINFL